MAQVMVNFRLDEAVKKNMELACREMGLSMTAAFTIFAKKVGNEKRIPFEITAEPRRSQRVSGRRSGAREPDLEEPSALARRQERLEGLCMEIRQSLTAIHTAIPASITGLPMERIRLLCRDELKDKAAGIAGAARSLFSGRNAGLLEQKDLSILDEYTDALDSLASELLELKHTLIPAMKSQPGDGDFAPYEQRLAAVSQGFDGLSDILHRFLSSTACASGARVVRERIRQAARPVETPYVRTALESLEAQILRDFDGLEDQAKAHLEADYLPTLELTLRELGWAEQEDGDAGGKAALCLRVINVLAQMIADGRQARREWSERSLEAEVAALERLAAMRGDVAGQLQAGI